MTKKRPAGWAQSRLGPFLELMWSNAIATFANTSEAKRIKDIDVLLSNFSENASIVPNKLNVGVGIPLLLFFRAHSAFRAAAGLAFGGAIPEAMAVLRLALETAGYASMMQGNESLATIWINRSNNEKTKRAAISAFKHSHVRKALQKRHAKIGEHYHVLYERLIDSGAHPNEFALMRSLLVEPLDDGGARMTQVYLQDNPEAIEFVLRAAGQVGVCMLMIFEMMYPDEFRQLEISRLIPHVSRGL